MKKSKLIVTALCVALLMTTAVVGTIAYLTDRDSVENTFTIGNIDINLDEAPVDENGKATTGDRVKENDYHILPGAVFDKDPTVTVKAGSEESYVRMIMTVHNASAVQAIIDNDIHGLTDYADLFAGWDQNVWKYVDFEEDTTANTISFEFRYNGTVDGFDAEGKEAEEVLKPLFTQLVVPGTLTGDEVAALYGDDRHSEGDFKITVEGHAIQVANIEATAEKTAEDVAWEAFDKQYGAQN